SVDEFEVVEIGHHGRDRSVFAMGSCYLPVQGLQNGPAVEKPGEGIVGGLDSQLLARSDELLLKLEDALAGAQAGFQFLKVEWLGDVVVRAGFQALDDFRLVAFGGQ